MAGFSLIRDKGTEDYWPHPISSLTLSIGDLLELDAGATTWTEADSSTEHWQKKAVCVASASASDSTVLAVDVLPGMLWSVESANNSSSDDDGDRMVLTDKNTVNNSGSDDTSENACFVQRAQVNSASDQTVLGEIVYGTGVDPDAS